MSTLIKHDLFEGLLESAHLGFENSRAEAKTSYYNQGLPVAKAEEYKFTGITKKLEQTFPHLSAAQSFELSLETVKSAIFEGFSGDILVFTNGKFQPSLSSIIDGLEVSLLSEKPDTPIGSIAKPSKDAFCALNQASFEDGIFISVPKKTQIEKPILLLSFNKENSGSVIQPRVWIEVGDFAEVTFIDQSINLSSSPYFINKVIEIKGAANAHVHYYRLQNEGKNTFEVSNIETNIQKDSTFASVTISLSGEMI